MPIYSYRCTSCGHAQDALQKMSDPPLTVCPACGAATYQKQVTAAGFQLKGSGWYVTDFRSPQAQGGAKGEKQTGAEGATSTGTEADKVAAAPKADAAKADAPAPAPKPAAPPDSGT